MPPRRQTSQRTAGELTVKVEGLAELRKQLRQADKEMPKELAEANQKAAEIVAEEARRLAPRGEHEGGGDVTPIHESIKARRAQKAASIAIGGPKSPHAAPTEFGGTLRRRNSAARTKVKRQAYLYPAIAAKRDEVRETYGKLLDQLTDKITT